jgi:hypothetical protein
MLLRQKNAMKLAEMRVVVLVRMIMALVGCASTNLAPKPADGYPAFRFVQTVSFDGPLLNTWTFHEGALMVGNRTRDSDGQLLYCGPMSINDMVTFLGRGSAETSEVCVFKRDNKLVISGAISGDTISGREFEREIPPGAIEEVRYR